MKSVLVVVMGLISLFSAGCTSPVIKSPEDPAHATVEQQPSPLREANPRTTGDEPARNACIACRDQSIH